MGGTPLHCALQSGCVPQHDVVSGPFPDIVELLLAHGADVNARGGNGVTSLLAVTASGWYRGMAVQLAELFVTQGADVMARNKEGMTPLHGAALCRDFEMVKLLIEAGADVNAKDSKGRTPLSLVQEKGGTKIIELLRERGAVAEP
jgi:ankyrin repeat protein